MSWKCINSSYLIDNNWLKVRKDAVQVSDTLTIDDYYVIEKKDVVLIIAVSPDGRILLKKEYRYPIDKVLLELPGGTIDRSDELPEQTAKRELSEETGFASDNWKYMGFIYDYPTKDTNCVHLYIALDAYKSNEPVHSESERVHFTFYDTKTVCDMIKAGEINVSGTLAALTKYIFIPVM